MREVRVSHRVPRSGSPLRRLNPDLASDTPASPRLSYPPTSRCHSSPGSRSRFDFVPNVKAPRLYFRFRGGWRVAPGSSTPTPKGRATPSATSTVDTLPETRMLRMRHCLLPSWPHPGRLHRFLCISASPPRYPRCPSQFMVQPDKMRLCSLGQTIFSNDPSIRL